MNQKNKETTRLEYGKEYNLYTMTPRLLGRRKTIKAFYLGYIEPKKQDSLYTDGGGHLFFRENEEKLELYLTKSSKAIYLNNGPGDPAYYIGIEVYNSDKIKLSEEEIRYLHQLNQRKIRRVI